ncbi:hypothetical protein V6N13_032120 [Hibiscus sabdariffa]|uniref:Uncharacterized protein n=2 Tax=Hibiscus sabdariffa TaxID=183260 RepID=A0ABR2AR29_9ROSI
MFATTFVPVGDFFSGQHYRRWGSCFSLFRAHGPSLVWVMPVCMVWLYGGPVSCSLYCLRQPSKFRPFPTLPRCLACLGIAGASCVTACGARHLPFLEVLLCLCSPYGGDLLHQLVGLCFGPLGCLISIAFFLLSKTTLPRPSVASSSICIHLWHHPFAGDGAEHRPTTAVLPRFVQPFWLRPGGLFRRCLVSNAQCSCAWRRHVAPNPVVGSVPCVLCVAMEPWCATTRRAFGKVMTL